MYMTVVNMNISPTLQINVLYNFKPQKFQFIFDEIFTKVIPLEVDGTVCGN